MLHQSTNIASTVIAAAVAVAFDVLVNHELYQAVEVLTAVSLHSLDG